MTGNAKAYNSGNLNSDRIPGTERHLINLQYSNTDFLGRREVYYRDETLTFYPFPTLADKAPNYYVSSIGASQQKPISTAAS